ncbi:MAG: hypothetical protein H0U74_08680 [Bradymonadaceae bacterium]|nr:hypothetical protein [Lujinxingiaceae bacterium]
MHISSPSKQDTLAHRRRRLEQLRDRFVAVTLGTRSLRLTRPVQSGALDLFALHEREPHTFRALLAALGQEGAGAVALCDVRASEDMERFAREVGSLAHAVREQRMESGTEDLAVGWPFLEGKTRDGTWLRAPILLFPVALDATQTGRLQWRLAPEGAAELNEPLMQLLARLEGVRPTLEDIFGEESPKIDASSWQTLVTYFERTGLAIEATPSLGPLTAVEALSREQRDGVASAKLWFSHHAVLGRFPVAGSNVVVDYDALLSASLDDASMGLASELLLVDEDSDWSEEAGIEEPVEQAFDAEAVLGALARWQVFASDASQDAVFRFLEREKAGGLVVQGPPGTGKSQLIGNLVAASIARGDRVLVVCSKRAALDVVADRLAAVGLSEPLALVHDVSRDRNAVCNALSRTLDQLEEASDGASEQDDEIVRARRIHEQALSRLLARLGTSQQAFNLLARRHNGRPSLAELQERALDDDGRALPDLRDVAHSVTENAAVADLARIDALGAHTTAIASPDLLARRGDWAEFEPAAIDALYERVASLQAVVRQMGASKASMTPGETAGHDGVWQAASPLLDMLEFEQALVSEFLLFWGWMGGETEHGEWHRVMTLLEQARTTLTPVPYELIVVPMAKLARWIDELDQLAALEARWYRVLLPKYWRLRKLPAEILGLCNALVGDDAMPVNVRDLCARAKKWQRFISDLPSDNALFDFGFDGTLEDIDTAIETLRRQHTFTRCLHELQGALAGRGAPYDRLPDLGPHLENPVREVATFTMAIGDRAVARGMSSFETKLDELVGSGGLDERFAVELQAALAGGDFTAVDEALEAFLSTRERAEQAVRIDRLVAGESAWVKRFLRLWRPDAKAGAKASSAAVDAMAALERAWHALLVGEREPAEIEAPLVDADYLAHMAEDVARCRDVAGNGVFALYHHALSSAQRDPNRRIALQRLAGEARKQRNRASLRQLIERYWDTGLGVARPVWLCSPEAVSALFPLTPGLFDLVIFDEASQCPVESALPALVRAKRAIVAGDDQQMPPSHFFRAGIEHDEDEENTLLATRSILALARVAYANTTLRWHYRSRHEELIAFSNRAFYGGRLITAPSAQDQVRHPMVEGLHLARVDGLWEEQTNVAEARRVVELVAELLDIVLAEGSAPTVGVVTFNRKQTELIELMLDARRAIDPQFRRALERDGERVVVEQLFVRNLENVQGDERDVIVLSTGYAPSEPGGPIHARFGPIGQQGGEKRLNVAITRARLGTWLVTSIDPDALKVAHTRHVGPQLLKAYIGFVQAFSRGDVAGVERLLEQADELGRGQGVTGQGGRRILAARCGQRVRDELGQALEARGLHVSFDVGLGSQSLDIAVAPDAHTPARVGIDCTQFLATASPLARDVHGPLFWTRMGWTTVRVTPAMWHEDRAATIRRILATVEQRYAFENENPRS